MGRRDEFHGGAYGNFQPESVDLDLSDKVTDHPHYSQDPSYQFHEPNEPMNTACQQPGCGRNVHEHRAQSMKPTRAGYEQLVQMGEAAKTERREAKGRQAQELDDEEQHMKSHHGTAPHFVSGKGWANERGPRTRKQFHQHLVEDHDVWEEDAAEMENPATAHARWHADTTYGGENHEHHTEQKRFKPEDE